MPLKQFSDIVYLEWQHLLQLSSPPPNKVPDLRYVFKLFISNDITNDLIKRALSNKKQKLTAWPGSSFSPDSDEFKALLGSPNGGGIGWLLINHKVQLGLKTVSKITVFRHEGGDNDPDPMMLFEIKDVDAAGRGQDGGGEEAEND